MDSPDNKETTSPDLTGLPETETISEHLIPQSEPENMEVHYEPHFKHGHHKKHLKENAKEFLMIFFAVFMGFLAESWREHLGENAKEKDYIRGFVADLKEDQRFLTGQLDFTSKQAKEMDTLAKFANQNTNQQNEKQIYALTNKYEMYYNTFNKNDVTMQQVKNAGDLTILNKKHVADSLLAYYSFITWIDKESSDIAYFFKDIKLLEDGLFRYDILLSTEKKLPGRLEFPPLSKDKLHLFANKILYIKNYLEVNNQDLRGLLKYNKRLIKFLENTYYMKDE